MTELKATEPIEQLFEKLRVDAVFGQPVHEGDVTIIPVADVGVGFGFGSGSSPATEDEGEEADRGKSEGGGAGGKATPRGYIKITPDGVDFVSTLDEGRVALAGIAMVAWAIFWIAMTIRAFVKK
ncbi:spore germination protein GerW family protein [Chloroflexota bacterium]